jgi:hypothetical protein
VIEGAVVSLIVNVAVVVLALVQSSVAVNVIVIVRTQVPLHICVFALLLHVTLLPHKSLATAPPFAASHANAAVFAFESVP